MGTPLAIVLRRAGLIAIQIPGVVIRITGIFRLEFRTRHTQLIPALPVVARNERLAVRDNVAQLHARMPGKPPGLCNISPQGDGVLELRRNGKHAQQVGLLQLEFKPAPSNDISSTVRALLRIETLERCPQK